MEPIIYMLPFVNKPLEISKDKIHFDIYPSPKLIKYGLNNLIERLDLVSLTSVSYYKAGLHVDFSRTDAESFTTLVGKKLGTKKIDQTFAEFWEIITLFNLLEKDKDILTNSSEIVSNLLKTYTVISKTKKSFSMVHKTKKKASLVLHKFSEVDLEENASIQLIINDLDALFSSQKEGATLVLQIFGVQTQTMVELIYYLLSNYEEAYIFKPTVISEIFDQKYLILKKLRNKPRFSLPKHSKNTYLVSLGLSPPQELVTKIQCLNAETIPARYNKYHEIKTYLDSKVYEGATYQEMLQSQNDFTKSWTQIFTHLTNLQQVLDKALEVSNQKCVSL